MFSISTKLNFVKHLTINSYNDYMDFHEWINKKFVEWRGPLTLREGGSQDKFAQWIGISPQLMTDWLKRDGKTPKQKKTIDKLIRKYGSEVYKVLNIPPPPEFIRILEEFAPIYDELSSDRQEEAMRRIREIFIDSKNPDE